MIDGHVLSSALFGTLISGMKRSRCCRLIPCLDIATILRCFHRHYHNIHTTFFIEYHRWEIIVRVCLWWDDGIIIIIMADYHTTPNEGDNRRNE